jgi:hypothetical protein
MFADAAAGMPPAPSGLLSSGGGSGGKKKGKGGGGGGGLKRRRPGYGTDSGPYVFAKPDVHIWHQEFATPQGPLDRDNVMIEIEVPRNQIIRWGKL